MKGWTLVTDERLVVNRILRHFNNLQAAHKAYKHISVFIVSVSGENVLLYCLENAKLLNVRREEFKIATVCTVS